MAEKLTHQRLEQRIEELETELMERKQIEEFHRITLENILDPVFITDSSGKFTFICSSASHTLGYTVEELEQKIYISRVLGENIFNPEELEDAGEIHNIERMIVDKYSRERIFLITVKRVNIKGGTHLYSCHEITERKHVEEERSVRIDWIQKQQAVLFELATHETLASGDLEQALRVITESVAMTMEIERVSVWQLNDDRQELHCFDLFEKTSGLHSKGVILEAINYPHYFKALESGRAIDAHDARADTRTSEFTESYFIPLGITSMLDAAIWLHGKIVGVVCYEHVGKPRSWRADETAFAGDIAGQVAQAILNAERKEATEALKESEEFLNAIVENIPDMIFIKDAKELQFERFNKAGEELLGYSREELIGKNDYDFFPKEEANFFTRKDREVLDSGTLLDIPEEHIQTKYKGERTLHTKKIPLLDEEGKPRYLLGISEDITERKQTEKILQKRSHDLNERVKELNCLYGISKIIEKRDISLDEILKDIVDIIPPSWQYPEITCSRIIVKGNEYKTQNFTETIWNQSSEIVVRGERVGMVEVYYLEKKPKIDEGLFLKEELNLLKAISERIGRIIERTQTEQDMKILSGLLPICAQCKKIRDDQGYWNQIEVYVRDHSEAEFSHGLCPECSDKLYSDEDWYKK